MGDWIKEKLRVSPESHLDCHFTYPTDGNYHYSFKARNDGVEQYVSVFWNCARIKSIRGDSRRIVEVTREELANGPSYILGHLVPVFKPEPLDRVAGFQFVSMGFNVLNGNFGNHDANAALQGEPTTSGDDLIVDVEALDKVSVSVSCHFTNAANKGQAHLLYNHGQLHSIAKQVSANIELELACHLSINEEL